MKKSGLVVASFVSFWAVASAHAGVEFRHSASDIEQSAAYVVGAVNADSVGGEIVFRNFRADAVTAYIHDKNGNIVDMVVIPGKIQSNFGAAWSAISDTISPKELLSGAVLSSWNDQSFDPLKSLKGFLNNGSSLEYSSGLASKDFPNGGSISYAVGTKESIAGSYIGVAALAISNLLTKALTVKNDDLSTSKEKFINEIIKQATRDPILIGDILAGRNNDAIYQSITSWIRKNYDKSFVNSGLAVAFANIDLDPTEAIEKSISVILRVDAVLNYAAKARDIYFQETYGPQLLFYDMSYDAKNGILEDAYQLNWNNTELATLYPPIKFDSSYGDPKFSWLKPSTWLPPKPSKEYDRYQLYTDNLGNADSLPNTDIVGDNKTDFALPKFTPDSEYPYVGAVVLLEKEDGEDFHEADGGFAISRGSGSVAEKPSAQGTVKLSPIDGQRWTITAATPKVDRYGPGGFANLASNENDKIKYDYTAWGKWDTVEFHNGYQYEGPPPKGYWVAGAHTPSKQIADRKGTATYAGAIIGDYAAKNSTKIERGVATGDLNLKMDFSKSKLSGDAKIYLTRNGTTSLWLNPSLSGQIAAEINSKDEDDREENGLGPVFGAESQKYSSNGESVHSVNLFGFFYGPNGIEIGGIVNAQKYQGQNAGTVAGVFRGKEKK